MKTIIISAVIFAFCSIGALAQPKDVGKAYFTDTVLVDQNGKGHRFYSDLLEGKVVILGSFHADCTSIGPPMMATMKRLQKDLSARASEFNIIFISVDPTDDVAKSQTVATKYGAGPGWYFLTGQKANVDIVLKKLGMAVANKEDHSPVLSVGNVKTGLWKKIYGLTPPAKMLTLVEEMLDDKK